jgi:signal transduction histidine kinase
MHRPWQIWSIFAAALLAVTVAVAWLSFKALEADKSDALAKQQAMLEENARLALWRMDSSMAALVTQESARPYFVYRSFLPAEITTPKVPTSKPTKKQNQENVVPSPLLAQNNPLFSLYFQINTDGVTVSPQCPTGAECTLAVPTWLSEDEVVDNGKSLRQVSAKVNREKLLEELRKLEVGVPQTGFIENGMATNQAVAPNQPPGPSQQSKDNSQRGADSQRQVALAPDKPQAPSQRGANLSRRQQRDAPNSSGEGDEPYQGQQLQQPMSAPEAQLYKSQAEAESRTRFIQQGNSANYNLGLNNDFLNGRLSSADEVAMTMMKPMWVDDDLLLARRVTVGKKELVQAAVLNWPAVKEQLLDEIADLLPDADLQPVKENSDEAADVRRLASLPVRLVPGPPPKFIAAGFSPVQMSLLVAWIAMSLAAAAVAVLLRGVIALSERRAAFVSAVTHELRTPLTTFRMYAEMLSEGMVRDEGDRRNYLNTLRREAERLTHLVANVLAYARLERGRSGGRVEIVSVDRLLEVATQRLTDRAAQCDLTLNVAADANVLERRVKTDPSAVEQILFNLVDNACKYAATAADRTLQLSVTTKLDGGENGAVYLRLTDHGPGISPEEERRIFQPFRKSAKDAAHSAPGVGLGLALSRRLARDMNGDLRYEPHADGACFVLSLPTAS